jgi:hypothetical protein
MFIELAHFNLLKMLKNGNPMEKWQSKNMPAHLHLVCVCCFLFFSESGVSRTMTVVERKNSGKMMQNEKVKCN